MAPRNPIEKSLSSEIPDIIRNTAIVIISISIALASISFTLLSVLDAQLIKTTNNVAPLKLVFFIFGLLFIYVSALVTDWLIDNFSEKDWKSMFGKDFNPNKYDQILARFRLFGGGYSIFCLCFSGISFGIVSQTPIRIAITNPLLNKLVPVVAIITAFYIFSQMMTYKKVKGIVGLILLVIIIGFTIIYVSSGQL